MVVGNLVYILGGLVIVVALLLFLWATVITLFDKNQGAGVT
jgi:predicted transglutaminase-like protease